MLLFIVQREDCDKFRPATQIDPEYANLLKEALSNDVEILVYQTKLTEKEIYLDKRLVLVLD